MRLFRNYEKHKFFLPFIVLIFALTQSGQSEENRWEAAINTFETNDADNPPKNDAVLFVGSSSIRMWKTSASDFPSTDVINRGFGGSEISDLVTFANRIVIPYQPRLILVYSGDNDIAGGKSPQRILEDFCTFVETVHDTLPDTPIAFISIKPSLARWNKVKEMKKANELLRDYIDKNPKLEYIDIFTPMICDDGEPRSELFLDDGLHLNARGYKLWVEKVEPFVK